MGRNVSSITNIRPDQTLAELLVEEIDPWQHKPDSRICLPLGHAETIPMSEELPDTPGLGITGAYLKRYPGPDADPDTITDLRPGWVYVYLNGFLWREVKVTPNATFKDVDLRTYQGLDTRPASGLDEYTLLFPHRLRGEESTVQLAYSEVQWSWHRIVSLGGMDPEDPRRRHRVAADETLSHLAQRYPGVANWQALADLNDLDDPDSLQEGDWLIVRPEDQPPADADDRRQTRMGTPVNERDEFHNDEGTLVLEDPLGVADTLVSMGRGVLMNHELVIGTLRGEHLKDHALDIGEAALERGYFWTSYQEGQEGEVINPTLPPLRQPGEHWREHCENLTAMAQLVYPALFDPSRLDELDADERTKLLEAAEKMSLADMEAWLHVDERRAMRQTFRAVRDELGTLLRETTPHGEGLMHAFSDYAYLPVDSYYRLWERFNDLVGLLIVDPASTDHAYDLPSVFQEEQQHSLDCLTFLVDITHPQDDLATEWHRMLFPTAEQVDISTSAAPAFSQLPDPDPFSPAFRPRHFADSLNALADDHTQRGVSERALFNVLDKSVNLVVALSQKLPEAQQYIFDGDLFFRLLKGSDMPLLKNLRVSVSGDMLDSEIPVGQYRVEDVLDAEEAERLSRADRRAYIRQAAQNTDRPYLTIYDHNGHEMGGSDFRATTPFVGRSVNSGMITNARELFQQVGQTTGQEGIYRSQSRLVLLPEGPYHTALSAYRRSVTTAANAADRVSSSVPYRGFPTVLLGLEVLNLNRRRAELAELEESNLVREVSFYGEALIKLTAASFVAAEAWSGGAEQFVERLRQSHSQTLRLTARTIPVMRMRIPVYSTIIFAGLLIEFGYGIRESVLLFRKNNPTAGTAMAVGSLMSLVGGVVALKATSMAFVGKIGWLIPGIGWVVTLLGAGMVYWANRARHTPLEHWATNGPFGLTQEDRLSQDDLADSTLALQTLQNVFISPYIHIKRTQLMEQPANSIAVEVDYMIPAYQEDTSDLYVTLSIAYPGSHAPTIPAEHDVLPVSAQVLPANDERPMTLRCHYLLEDPVRWQGGRSENPQNWGGMPIEWLPRVRHQVDPDFNLPLNDGNTGQPGWSTIPPFRT